MKPNGLVYCREIDGNAMLIVGSYPYEKMTSQEEWDDEFFEQVRIDFGSSEEEDE